MSGQDVTDLDVTLPTRAVQLKSLSFIAQSSEIALQVNQPQATMDIGSGGSWTRRQEQGEEVDFEALKLVKTNHDVNVKVADNVDLEGLPGECNLMAVSNTWGLLAVGGNNEVRIHRLAEFHRLLEDSPKDASPIAAPATAIPLPGRPVWLRLAVNEEILIVSISESSSVQLFRLRDVMSGNTVTSGLPGLILDILPNPAPPNELDTLARNVALVSADGLYVLDVESGRIRHVVQDTTTSASWSPKGKQIVCGHRSGKLVQYTPEGNAKAEVPPPPELSGNFMPTSIEWIENDVFLVSYKNGSADDDEPLSVFTIQRSKAASEIVYHEFFDPLNTMGLSSRPGSHRFISTLRQWGNETRHLSFLISGRSSEVGVMRMIVPRDQQAPIWETLMLEETARGVMPAGKSGVSDDAACLGLELDLTSAKPIVMGIIGGVEVPDLPPAPRLLAYTQEGSIVSFDLRYQDAGEYPHMVKSQDIMSTPARSSDSAPESSATSSTPAAQTPQADQKPAFGGFGSQPSAFGSTAFGKSSTPSTSSAGFGQSAFGQPSSGGFGQSAFGQPSTPSSSSNNAFGQSATPAFGFSGFGPKPIAPTPAPSTPSNSSAFGQSSTSSAFGKPAFGSASSTGAFGQNSFGQIPGSAPTAFGQSSTGSKQPPISSSAFGATASSASQATTSSASTTAFGQPAFGQNAVTPSSKPAFGQTSTPSAFGQSAFGQASKPSAFGQPTATSASAFGSSSSSTTGGFAGFGQKAGGQTGFGFGSSTTPNPAPSGGSPFGSGGLSSAFGSSSAFGQSASGAKPAASAFSPASTSQAEKPSPAFTPAASSGFGLGGLDSALGETTPPDSPFGAGRNATAPPVGGSQTPPDSPVFGASRQLSGRDDDDESPPPTPKPASQPPPKPTSSTSSFIKPATAFGSATASGFGSFGQTPTKPPATSTTPAATPNAFSQPVNTTSSSGAFGSTGFGSTAFGQSSTPSAASAFGRTAAPPPAVGTISGGFGGFAAKKSDSASAFSGFGATPGKSAFGSSSTGGSFSSLLAGSSGATPPATAATITEVKKEPVEPPSDTKEKPEQPRLPVKAETPASPTEVKPEIQSPEPEGYDVPTSNTQKADIPGKPAANTDEPESLGPGDTQTGDSEDQKQQDDVDEADRGTGSSPELVHHEDAESEEGDEVAGNEESNSREAEEDEEEYSDDDDQEEEGDGAREGVNIEEVEEVEEGYDYDDETEEDYEDEGNYEDDIDEEAVSGEEADESPEKTVSPPAEAATDTAPSDTTSLFSRLGPPTSRPSYQGKHAVRTSSPLGSQPPENADTATPPGTPPQPSPAISSKDASNAAPPPFFSFNSGTTSKITESNSPTTETADAGPPPLFGSSISSSTTPTLGLGKPPAEQANPKPAFSFGLGKPSTAPIPATSTEPEKEKKPFFGLPNSLSAPVPSLPASKLPFAFGTPSAATASAAPSTAPAKSPSLFGQAQDASPSMTPAKVPSLFGQPQTQQTPALPSTTPAKAPSLFGQTQIQQKPTSAPITTSVKPVQPITPAADAGKFATPARTPVQDPSQAKDDGSRQMAAVMTRMVTDLMSEIRTLREALFAHAEYHRGLEPKFDKVNIDDLDKHSDLPFSSLSDITQVIDQLTVEMKGVTQVDQKTELRILELQSKMVKTDMKSKQAERLVAAHDDPTAAYYSNSQDLSSSQLEERASLRRRKQSAESRLDDLERSVERLKKAAAEGRPTVEKLHQSIDEVEAAIVDKQDLIEDLSMRVKSIRLSTPGSRRSTGYTPTSRQTQDVRNKAISFAVPPEIVTDVQRQLDRQDRKLSFSSYVARVTRAGKTGSTVQVGKLPLPGKVDIAAWLRDDDSMASAKVEPEEKISVIVTDQRPAPGSARAPSSAEIKADATTATASGSSFPPAFSLTPGPTTSSPSPAFGGIKLSLDPGELSSSHNRSRAAVAGTRAHHSAPRLNSSPSSEKSGYTPAVSFFPPPGGETSASPSTKNSPKGFFSFSGYGQ